MKLSEKLRKHKNFDDKLREHEQKFRLIKPTGDEFLDAKVTSLNVDDLRAELLRLRNEIVALQEKRTECEGELQFEITRLKCDNRRLTRTVNKKQEENRVFLEEIERLSELAQMGSWKPQLLAIKKPKKLEKSDSLAEQRHLKQKITKTAVNSSSSVIQTVAKPSSDPCWQKQPLLEEVLQDLSSGSTVEIILEEKQIEDIAPLAEPLGMNRSCRLLNLCNNRIACLLPFKQCLMLNTTLCKLFLSHNGISNVTPIAQGLRTNSGLWELSLSGNLIEDITPLAMALMDNKSLLKLFLSNNRIKDIATFSKTLAVNQRLQRLDISHNIVEVIGNLPNILHKASFLKRLDLEKNSLGVFQRMQLKRAGERHSIQVKLS